MMLLHPRVNERFEFTDGGEETSNGRVLRKATYREAARPTLIKTTRGRDLALTGTIWIDPFSGAVVKTEMNAADPAVRCQVTVSFRRDEVLELWVPVFLPPDSYRGRGSICQSVSKSQRETKKKRYSK